MSEREPEILHMAPVPLGPIAYYRSEGDAPAEQFAVVALVTYRDRFDCVSIAPVVADGERLKICGLQETLAPDLPADEQAARYLGMRAI